MNHPIDVLLTPEVEEKYEPTSSYWYSPSHADTTMPSTNSPKVELLKEKLALIMGCLSPIYGEVRAAHPEALNEAWSSRMDGERIYASKFPS